VPAYRNQVEHFSGRDLGHCSHAEHTGNLILKGASHATRPPASEEQFFMAYVVTDACTKDFVCVAECATAAIAPTAGDPAAGTVSQVFINPDECIDCGNCADICAQNAIFPGDELPADKADFAEKNRAYFQ
jgi:NAD-dependent dihydropyrimidine dehydrogenase PreA subunit